MKDYGILRSADDIIDIPSITNPVALYRYFSDPKTWSRLSKQSQNMVNG
jgi:hypothetical protein